MSKTKNTTAGEPVEEQAPSTKAPEIAKTQGNAVQTTAEAPATDKPGEDNGNTPPPPATDALAPSYLSGGYYKGEGKTRYPDPALVDQAEEIGKALAAGGVTVTVFSRILRTLKSAAKLSEEAQTGAFKKVLTQITDLENRKKAPLMLRKVVERNRAAVHNEADFAACLDHFKDIRIYLTAQAGAEGTPKK